MCVFALYCFIKHWDCLCWHDVTVGVVISQDELVDLEDEDEEDPDEDG